MRRILLAIIIAIMMLPAALTEADARRRSSKDVKRERRNTEQQIKRTQKQIADNDRETSRQLNRLASIKANMELRADTIASVKTRLDSVNRAIGALNDSIAVLARRDSTLKANYARSLRTMRARRQGMSDLAFVFAAESFGQAWRRLRYLREIAKTSERQARRLKAASQKLADARAGLDSLRADHSRTLASLNTAQASQRTEQVAADRLVSDLRRQGKSLGRELERRRKQAKALSAELDRIVEQEIAEARERERREAEARRKAEEAEKKRRAEEAARKERERLEREKKEREQQALKEQEARRQKELEAAKAKDKKEKEKSKDKDKDKNKQKPKPTPTPAPEPKPAPKPAPKPDNEPVKEQKKQAFVSEAEAERRLTGSFESNKGRLLFPVAGRYTVISKFGTYEHPELSKVKLDNLGIDIEVPRATSARAVFEGTVSSIFRLDGYHNIVILRHGEYLTVYAGIDLLSVKKGDKVRSGQRLGTIYSDAADDGRSVLHFEIRHERQKLNPAEWVK